MLENVKREELCQVSLTGLRSLVLLGLLVQSPRSLEEIREEFLKLKLIEEDNSYDILRIDLNTLRAMGCEISRSSKSTNNKHVLTAHPFAFEISEEEANLLKKVYRRIANELDVPTLLKYHFLFKSLSEQVNDENMKERLLGISILKSHNVNKISSLVKACKSKKTVTLKYRPAVKSEESEKEVIAQEVVIENDKIYLHAIDVKTKFALSLNISRIKEIISQKDSDEELNVEPIVVRFELKSFGVAGLSEKEKIIEEKGEKYIIEGEYYNEFYAIQRMLSFASSCTVISPENIKQRIIEKLKRMKEIYNG